MLKISPASVSSEEVQEYLGKSNTDSSGINWEEPVSEESSPLNQAVAENEVGMNSSTESDTTEDPDISDNPFIAEEGADELPEQNISDVDIDQQPEETVEIPLSHATQAADAMLGMTNNLLSFGGGFFVKIKKDKEFYQFDEVIQIIDEHNVKNIRRVQLDQEDQALLRPLIAQVLKKRATELSPEQQLIAAIVTILIKKFQIIFELRAENEIMLEQIRQAIHKENAEPEGTEEIPEVPTEEFVNKNESKP